MFTRSADLYDAVYSFKDYERECEALEAIIEAHSRSQGTSLLDVACGTGRHLEYLQRTHEVEGLDLDPELLALARERLPGVPLHTGDMTQFDLGRTFDVVTCLFSAIGYVETLQRLHEAVATMTRHVSPGGLLIVEPWLTPEVIRAGHVSMRVVDEPELKVARVSRTEVEGRLSRLTFHYLVAKESSTDYFTEVHSVGLFTEGEMRSALAESGLDVEYSLHGLMDRGLWIGVKPAA